MPFEKVIPIYEPILKIVKGDNEELCVETELKVEDVIGEKTNIVTLPLSEKLGRSLIDYCEGMIESDIDEEDKKPLRFVKKEIEQYFRNIK